MKYWLVAETMRTRKNPSFLPITTNNCKKKKHDMSREESVVFASVFYFLNYNAILYT